MLWERSLRRGLAGFCACKWFELDSIWKVTLSAVPRNGVLWNRSWFLASSWGILNEVSQMVKYFTYNLRTPYRGHWLHCWSDANLSMTLSSFHNQCHFSNSLASSEIVVTLKLLSFLQASFCPGCTNKWSLAGKFQSRLHKQVQSCVAGVSQCAVISRWQAMSQVTVTALNSHPEAMCDEGVVSGDGEEWLCIVPRFPCAWVLGWCLQSFWLSLVL